MQFLTDKYIFNLLLSLQPMGVFAILEEESIVPKATDATFRDKLYGTHEKKSPAFAKPKIVKKGGADFICKHYAGDVSRFTKKIILFKLPLI